MIYDTSAPEQAIRVWAADARKAAWQADCLTRSDGSIDFLRNGRKHPGGNTDPAKSDAPGTHYDR